MAKQASRTVKRGSKQAGKGRKRRAEDLLGGDGDRDEVFQASDAEAGSADDEEEEEVEETAAEKRLRVAKAYLDRMRQDEAGTDEDEEGPAGHDALSEKLKQQAMEAMGHLQRRIAAKVHIPDARQLSSAGASTSGRFTKCHKLSVTALAVTADDAHAYTVSKDGSIFRTDIETGARTRFDMGREGDRGAAAPLTGTTAEWVKRGPRQAGARALLAAAVSDDGRYLAAGGGDSRVHVWDLRSSQYVQGFPGHKDIVSGLAFRQGTHELFSASFDRTVKLWSLDDRAYVDTLFGHQAEVLAIDVLRQERAVTGGHDHTCRVWKVPEESQLIFRAHSPAVDAVRYITGTQWLSGGADGSLALWSQMKKRPMSVVRGAHCRSSGTEGDTPGARQADGAGVEATSWVQSVAVCHGTDLVASGAGDGLIRLWAVEDGRAGSQVLRPLGGLPAPGFVNGLHLARSGRHVVAGMGQEPRLGRWARDAGGKNGVLVHQLSVDH